MADSDVEIVEPRSLQEQAADLRRMLGQDRLRAIALGVVSALPIVGDVLSETLANEVPAARERRLGDFLDRLAAEVQRLRDDLDAHLADDTFRETVETAFEEAIRASEAAKRAAYAAIIANSLTNGRPDEEERLLFLDIVRAARTLHLRALATALSVTEPLPTSEFYMGAARTVLLPRLPGFDANVVGLAWNDLSRWGFVNPDWSGLGATGTNAVSNLSAYVTPLGRRFAAFVRAENAM